MQKTLLFICCAIPAVLIWGCVASTSLYLGSTIDSVDIVPLQAGLHEGVSWRTFDVVLLFDYDLKDDILYVSGRGRLGDHYQGMYEYLRDFDAYLFQVDKNGRVLDTVKLPAMSMHRPDDDFKFEKALRIFPETTGLSFGYTGTVYEHERSGPVHMRFINGTSFRKTPRK